MTTLRKFISSSHLACGLVAGVVIAVMSATDVALADRSAGLPARVRFRFLPTGGTFEFVGKIAATLASGTSRVLVWTDFALSWRRLLPHEAATGANDRA